MSENGLHKIPVMKQALEAIQELHTRQDVTNLFGDSHVRCEHCRHWFPCETRRLADRALGAGNE